MKGFPFGDLLYGRALGVFGLMCGARQQSYSRPAYSDARDHAQCSATAAPNRMRNSKLYSSSEGYERPLALLLYTMGLPRTQHKAFARLQVHEKLGREYSRARQMSRIITPACRRTERR